MKFSLIIPTYNSMRWIQQCINSILAQSFREFDLIILDSGSTDDTIAWIRSVNDQRIKIYATDKRLGIVENWARITSIPKNEFMTIVGHDDNLYPDYLEKINNLITAFPDAGLYQTHFNFIDGTGAVIRPCAPMQEHISPVKFIEDILQSKLEITATGFMMRSKDYDAMGGIPPYPNLLYADIELWFRLIQNSYMVVSPKNCFEFRFHPANTSKSGGNIRFTAFEMSIDFLASLKNENSSYKKAIQTYGEGFMKNYVISNCHKLLYIPKQNRGDVTINKIVNASKRYTQKLLPGIQFEPEKFAGIIIAKVVDSNAFLRGLFSLYTKTRKRTF